jgi:hypothetical protein
MQSRDLDGALGRASCPWPVDSPMYRQHREETTRIIKELQSELNMMVRMKLKPGDLYLMMFVQDTPPHPVGSESKACEPCGSPPTSSPLSGLTSFCNNRTVQTTLPDRQFPARKRRKPRMACPLLLGLGDPDRDVEVLFSRGPPSTYMPSLADPYMWSQASTHPPSVIEQRNWVAECTKAELECAVYESQQVIASLLPLY